MIGTNPFAELTTLISPMVMQIYIIAMFVLVVGGTILDMMHKKSAEYFFANSKEAEKNATRSVTSGEKMSLAIGTVANEVLTSSEFQNPKRRMSHLMLMYGFIAFVVSTVVLIFSYTGGDAAPTLWTAMWHLGALSVAVGGYWFWFFIRVDVNSEGKSWYQLCQADLFIVSLLMTVTFALIWSATLGGGLNMLWFAIFIASSTTLFSTVLWSKFAHMFFKPAAAYQKKITRADGSRENLPVIPDLSSSETHARYPDIPEYMGAKPVNMGLGIKREPPNHY
ncbi:MAG: adenylyl-sulfate reductase [Gammaproteobacteria bacterium]|nr:adenylyl-sulfate reductase [Gammaproteobacteria bacterium]